jgi:hypothetical protein
MFEIVLSNKALIQFNGKVVEFFMSDGTARRYHVAHISTMKVKTNQAGQYRLELRTITDALEAEDVDETRVEALMEMIESVKDAIAIYQ